MLIHFFFMSLSILRSPHYNLTLECKSRQNVHAHTHTCTHIYCDLSIFIRFLLVIVVGVCVYCCVCEEKSLKRCFIFCRINPYIFSICVYRLYHTFNSCTPNHFVNPNLQLLLLLLYVQFCGHFNLSSSIIFSHIHKHTRIFIVVVYFTRKHST